MQGALFEGKLTIPSSNPANILFKAIAVYYAKIIPSANPCIISSIININNTSGPGSIDHINFAPGQKFKYLRTKVLVVSTDELSFKFDIIDGDALQNLFTKIEVNITITATAESGSTFNADVLFYAYYDDEITNKAVQEAMMNADVLFHFVDDYLKPRAVPLPLPLN